LPQTYEIEMRLTPEQYAAIRNEFRGTAQWAAFKGYYDWRTSGHAANAALAIDRFRDVLAEIILRRSGTSAPSLDDIIDTFYEDESERLKNGMLPVLVCPTDNDESTAYFTAKLGNIPRMNDHIAALIDRLELSAAPGDEIWRYRSRYFGPLAGHEGIALVRGGEVVAHEVVVRR